MCEIIVYELCGGKMKISEFSQSTIEQIGYYVYCLINPEDNRVFYIGKGKGNRVFAHAQGIKSENRKSEKIDLIEKIINSGNLVKHVVIRYGLTDKESKEVESALIDFIGIEKLSNIVKGNNSERGLIACDELELKFNAIPAEIIHNVMIVKLNETFKKDMTATELYEATSGNWKASLKSVKIVEYVLATAYGIIREVYVPIEWNTNDDGRLYFKGHLANEDIREFYVNKSIIDKSQNSIRYILNQDVDISSSSDEAKMLRAKEIRLSGDLSPMLIFSPQCCGCKHRIVDGSSVNCRIYKTASSELYEGIAKCEHKELITF